MKFSEKWLREWVNPALDSNSLDEQLSLAGLEIDGREAAAGDFTGVVIGEILSAEPHPNADKLQVCSVTDGTETVTVVCGALNARAGLKTAFARIGAVLPGNFKIKKAKLRDVESFGMLSSEQELGLSESHDGIMELPADAPVGQDIRDYLQLDDQIFDVDLTPNRSDCLSIAGLAREVGVLNRLNVTQPVLNRIAAEITEQPTINLEAPAACPRYLGRIIRGVNIQATTPLWMQEKLRRGGIRSLDPVVDITNYVMLELGQPMHAFDLTNIKGAINVRFAKPNEELTLLNGTQLKIKPETLVIADDQQALALAGIMGGVASSCNETTQDLMLEVAYFDPLSLAGQARGYGLHTDASHRFERGVDFKLQERAIERATELLLAITGGKATITEAVSESHLPVRQPVTLRKARLEQLLAIRLEDTEVSDILTRLGLKVTDTGIAWVVEVPSYRFDISIEEDLIEEVARVYGYDNLPVKAPTANLIIQSRPEGEISRRKIAELLISRGYQEAITYSFIDPKWSLTFDPNNEPLALANPISADLSVMRTSLLPGLAKALSHNQKRQQPRVRFFETGLRFIQQADKSLQQDPMLAGLISGNRFPEGWTGKAEEVDFFDIKGDFEALLDIGNQADRWQFRLASNPALHPGQSAEILFQQEDGSLAHVGWIGALHPQLMKSLDLRGKVYVFEITLASITQGEVPHFKAVSRFPEMRRDLALVVNVDLPVGQLLQEARIQGGEWLQKVTLFDVYQGKGVEEGKKSLALGLTWQHPSRTLTDEEINTQVNQVVTAFSQGYAAELRS